MIRYLILLLIFCQLSVISEAQNTNIIAVHTTGGKDGVGVIVQADSTGREMKVLYDFETPTPGGTAIYSDLLLVDTAFWGVVRAYGKNGWGVLFSWNPNTNYYHAHHHFNLDDGAVPMGKLAFHNGYIYGTTHSGGSSGNGTIFRYQISNKQFSLLHSFNSTNGRQPFGNLILIGNKFFGITNTGGTTGRGVLFEWDVVTSVFSKRFDFTTTSGGGPIGGLCRFNNILWGVTTNGGANNRGTIYSFDPNSYNFDKRLDFTITQSGTSSSNLVAQNGLLYGFSRSGGENGVGNLFEYNPSTNVISRNISLSASIGQTLNGSPVWYNNKIYGLASFGGSDGLGGIVEFDLQTLSVTEKVSFTLQTISNPWSTLVLYNDKLFGTVNAGGAGNFGGIIEYIPSSNQLFVRRSFQEAPKGALPASGLIEADGRFFGMTSNGGNNYNGIIYEYLPSSNTIQALHHFDAQPLTDFNRNLFTYHNGYLYGLRHRGGQKGAGSIFRFNFSNGTFQSFFEFDSTNGADPRTSLCIAEGKLYGVTSSGGTNNAGVIYSIDLNTLSVEKLFDFNSTQSGSGGKEALVFKDGILYGTTSAGGLNNAGTLYLWNIAAKAFVKLFDFSTSNGSNPISKLTIKDDKLFGFTQNGGGNSRGVIFSYDLVSNQYNRLVSLSDITGTRPAGAFAEIGDELFAFAYQGGSLLKGSLISYNTKTGNTSNRFDLDGPNGAYPLNSYPLLIKGALNAPDKERNVLINPATDGGFELGSTFEENGWTVHNFNGPNANGWVVGNAHADRVGTRLAYTSGTSNPANTQINPNSAGPGTSFFFSKIIQIPKDDSSIVLTFNHKQLGNCDFKPFYQLMDDTLTKFMTPTQLAPNDQFAFTIHGAWGTFQSFLPDSLAGKTIRIGFGAQYPSGSQPYANGYGPALDAIQLISRRKAAFSSVKTGSWMEGSTWDKGEMPGPADTAIISAGHWVFIAQSIPGMGIDYLECNGNFGIDPSIKMKVFDKLYVAPGGYIQPWALPCSTFCTTLPFLEIEGDVEVRGNGLIDAMDRGIHFLKSRKNLRGRLLYDQLSNFGLSRLHSLIIDNENGVEIVTPSVTKLPITHNISLQKGTFYHNDKLILDPFRISQTNMFTYQIGQGGVTQPISMVPKIYLAITYINMERAYDQPYIVGSNGEIPSDIGLYRLQTIGADSRLRLKDDLTIWNGLYDAISLQSPIFVDSGKALIFTSASFPGIKPLGFPGANTNNQSLGGFINGAVEYRLNGTTPSRVWPLGNAETVTPFGMYGIVANNAAIRVTPVKPEGSKGLGVGELHPYLGYRVEIKSGSVSQVDSISIGYSGASIGFADSNKMVIAYKQTDSPQFDSIGKPRRGTFHSTEPGASIRWSSLPKGNYNLPGTYAIAISDGGFGKIWTSAAKDLMWNNPANWSGNEVPKCADRIMLNSPFNTIIVNDDGKCDALFVGPGTIIKVQPGKKLDVGKCE